MKLTTSPIRVANQFLIQFISKQIQNNNNITLTPNKDKTAFYAKCKCIGNQEDYTFIRISTQPLTEETWKEWEDLANTLEKNILIIFSIVFVDKLENCHQEDYKIVSTLEQPFLRDSFGALQMTVDSSKMTYEKIAELVNMIINFNE